MGDVGRFHTAHKLTLMAHRPEAYSDSGPRGIGQGDGTTRIPGSLFDRIHDSARDHRHSAPAGQRAAAHARLLQADSRPRSRAELLALIEDYAGGRVPLVVPLTLFAHHIRRCAVPYLADQVYLRPHSVELMLRNHV